jgi:hypothetical protein
MLALTSLSPDPERREAQQEAIQSWRTAGLTPQTLNHFSECAVLARDYDLDIIMSVRTAMEQCGKHCMPINALLAHLATTAGQSVLLNSDLVLRTSPAQFARFAAQCVDGLGYLVKYNHTGDEAQAVREPYGIDAFVCDPSGISLGEAHLSLGQPVWDYWLPYEFMRLNKPLYTTDEPIALHRRHPQTWDMARWDDFAVEFCRVYQLDSPTAADRLLLFRGIHAALNRAQRIQVLD